MVSSSWSNIVFKGKNKQLDTMVVLSEKCWMNMSQSRLGVIRGREQKCILELYQHVLTVFVGKALALMCSLSEV